MYVRVQVLKPKLMCTACFSHSRAIIIAVLQILRTVTQQSLTVALSSFEKKKKTH